MKGGRGMAGTVGKSMEGRGEVLGKSLDRDQTQLQKNIFSHTRCVYNYCVW